jgi:cytochrome P450
MTTIAHSQPVPGPRMPAWLQGLLLLSPVRIPFDSLTYMTENARRYGRLFAIYAGDKPIHVITDPDLVHEILVTRAAEFHKAEMIRHATRPLVGNGLFLSEGDFWKRQRKLAQPAFHHQRIAAYGATVTAEAARTMAGWHDGETRELTQEMMALTLRVVNKTLFNVEVREQIEHIGALMHIVLEAANDRINDYEPLWERLFGRRKAREAAALAELDRLIRGIIAEHRTQGDTGDLLSMLLAARDENGEPMSEQQLRDEVMTLFIAGHETTANTLVWTFYLLAENPAVEAKLRAELDTLQGRTLTVDDLRALPYSEQVLKESMRLYPPAGGVIRQPLHDLELGGYPIPKGSDVAISTYAMHRDPALFPDPLRFEPERFAPDRETSIPKYAYLPFGAGPRICIGNSFAMMEARLALLTILQQWKLSLAPNQRVQAEQLFTIRPKGGLRMVVRHR